MIKKISIFFLLVIAGVLLAGRFSQLQAQWENYCCPEGYHDSFWACPWNMNHRTHCCEIMPFWQQFWTTGTKIVPKVPCEPTEEFNESVVDVLTARRLRELNPLVFMGANPELHDNGRLNVAGLINRALSFIFPLAGLVLFLMLVWGGFEMLTGAASKQNLDAGKQRITAALIGFLLLFVSYWIVQIIEYITGVVILG